VRHDAAVGNYEHLWGAGISAVLAGGAIWLGHPSFAGAFVGLAAIEIAFATFDYVRSRR
jgi:hypothetical protein